MARIVLATVGSGGDAFPFVAVGLELAARGHDCELAASPQLLPALRHAGLPLRATGPFTGRQAIQRAGGFDPRLLGYVGLDRFWRLLLAGLPRTVDDLRPVVRGADLVVSHVFHPAAAIAAEAEGVPLATLDLHPCFLPTRHDPPPGLPSLGPLDRLAWATLRAAWRRRVDPAINAERGRAGLGPVRDAGLLGGVSDRLCLSLADERYTPTRPDWTVPTVAVGFPGWDAPPALARTEADDASLAAFLAAGPPPVVVTLGTALPMDPGEFYGIAGRALELLPATRAIVLGASDLPLSAALADRVLVRAYLPLSQVLPAAAAVVHHGGVGTTQAAIRAGCPAVVVPRCYDQRYHARRVRALGAGTVLPWTRLDGPRLAAAIRRVTEDPAFATAARALAADLTGGDPAGRAADAIERTVTP